MHVPRSRQRRPRAVSCGQRSVQCRACLPLDLLRLRPVGSRGGRAVSVPKQCTGVLLLSSFQRRRQGCLDRQGLRKQEKGGKEAREREQEREQEKKASGKGSWRYNQPMRLTDSFSSSFSRFCLVPLVFYFFFSFPLCLFYFLCFFVAVALWKARRAAVTSSQMHLSFRSLFFLVSFCFFRLC